FPVLLIDVALVICYFVLAREVDLRKSDTGGAAQFLPSALPESRWILYIFWLYLIWDLWTKIVLTIVRREWAKEGVAYYIVRIVPTGFCLYFATTVYAAFSQKLTSSQVVIADITLLWLVLLFRAAKQSISAWWPKSGVRIVWKLALLVVVGVLIA